MSCHCVIEWRSNLHTQEERHYKIFSGCLKVFLHCRFFDRRILRSQEIAYIFPCVKARNDGFPAREVLSGCLKHF
ncbi:MAG: hypothetical protein IKI11_07770 [Neisseriaceae bacterium]|nr:hypothetical protein [Neisseriaceae bacterium]